ncbi:MAG: fatty acid desaturase, partial [Pseudomonadales bacterium]|nr:fatty acid desaturase [Pseudomonadales bacterium]
MNAKVSAEMLTLQPVDWTHYAKGIAWGTIVLFVSVVISYAGMISAVLTETISLPVGTLLSTLLLYLAFTVAHEAGHGNISHEVTWLKPVERLMGWGMTVPFLIIPFGLFAKIHDYHHAFTNDPDRDPDHWVSGNSWLGANFRALTLALNYIYLASTRFKDDPVIAQTHKSSLLYYSVTLLLSIGLIVSGYGAELLMIGIIPAFLASYILGMLFDWIPHMPTRQQSRYQNTRSYLFPGLKYLTLGQNYHHIHHLYPRVSWYNYARVFNIVRPELEANNAPIERLFAGSFSEKLLSEKLPGFGRSPYAQEPSSVDGVGKFTLQVERVHQETADSVAITFQSMNGKNLPFHAGQYVTVTKLLNGEFVTRCYSICESPHSGKLTIGVKRVEKGLLSTYLNDELCVGDELTVAGPFGDFLFDPCAVKPIKRLTLVAGGSGVTPVISIAQTALETCSKTCAETKVHLIYANRSIGDVMFLRQVNMLLAKYPDRFSVTYIFENVHAGWEGEIGYLSAEKLTNMFSTDEAILEGRYYICGPEV